MVLPPQPIANFNRNRRREFWNVAARLVRKLDGEEVGVEIDDGCRLEDHIGRKEYRLFWWSDIWFGVACT